jgi:tetratricopeptide (TPR) repeat protein
MHRILPLCLLGSCGVFGLSSEESEQLITYQQNAATYWESGDIPQAMDQARRGLQIDPDDYKLLTIWGYSLLRMSGDDQARIQQARLHFERLIDMRSMSQHSSQALLGYGLCLYRAGQLQRRQVDLLRNRLEHQVLDEMERHQLEASAIELDALLESSLRESRSVMETLVANGEELLLANKTLLEVNSLLPDFPAALGHGNAYLVEAKTLQEYWQREIETTELVLWEREARSTLEQFRDEEIEVRALMANLHAKLDQPAGVVEQLDIVLAMDRSRSIDYFNRAGSLRKLGRIDEMKSDFETFLSLTNLPPSDPRVMDAVQAIKGFREP